MLTTEEIRRILTVNVSKPSDRWPVMIGIIEALATSYGDPATEVLTAIQAVIAEGDRFARAYYNAE